MNPSPPIKCCCSPSPPHRCEGSASVRPDWIAGTVTTGIGEVPRVTTDLRLNDHVGSWKMRWALGRMIYRVEPGLYAVGSPTADSPVLVSANYKMSFDRLRSQLGGVNAWILVLDTQGINVWCAAGKGTFGTDELVRRIEAVRLGDVVAHRTLVVPQLAAPGVAAHEVKQRSGFRVVYGPVRAEDLPTFLTGHMTARPEMRQVQFPLRDRLVLVPVEVVLSFRWAWKVIAAFFLLAGLGPNGYSLGRAVSVGSLSAALLVATYCGSIVLTAGLLPWLPGRAFALKGFWIGLAFSGGVLGLQWHSPGALGGSIGVAGWCLILPAIASFMAMNFTGATTFTSLSGVRREMRFAVPIQVTSAVLGLVLWLAGRFT